MAVAAAAATAYSAYQQSKAQEENSRYPANLQSENARRQLNADKYVTGIELKNQESLGNAYRQAYQGAKSQYETTENDLSNLYSKSPEELEVLKQQIITGQAKELQQGTSQMQSALSSAGVRGTQAATQMRRGIGEMTQGATENINNLISQEAINRKASQAEYLGEKQKGLQNFMYSPEGAQYSEAQNIETKNELKKLFEKYQRV